jgi:transposase
VDKPLRGGGPNLYLFLPEDECQFSGVRKVGHDGFRDRGGISTHLVKVHANSELLGPFLPFRHRAVGDYLSIYTLASGNSIYLDTPRLSIYLDMSCSMKAMTGPEYEARLVRARDLASRPEEIEKLGENLWSVPSQSGFGRYQVYFETDKWSCGCKDFQTRLGEPCKHILSVRELLCATKGPSKSPKKRYAQNSAAFDAGQTKEMRLIDTLLRDLVSGVYDFPRTPGHAGRNPTPLSDAIYCAVLKVYSGLSGRRAFGVYLNVSDRGLLSDVPSYMVASRLLNRPEVTPILYRLLSLSAMPLAGLEDGGVVAPDSTGIQTTSFGAWREAKHGEQRVKKWLKLHALVGTKTHVIIRAVVGDEYSADSIQFGPLLRDTLAVGFHPGTLVADKGYLSKDNYALADSLGLEAYIPFKANTLSNEVNRIRGTKNPASWEKAYHLFQANRDEFNRNYHTRSNVESVFSALKRKFGENVRSKNQVAQVNEVLCKLIAYNLTVVVHEMFENGIAPNFVRHAKAE